jgi:hypothetical protein
MASSSVFKMATVFILALFAGQLLMATPTAADGIGNRRNLYDVPAQKCGGFGKCDTFCFAAKYKLCIIDPTCTVAFCESKAFKLCKSL